MLKENVQHDSTRRTSIFGFNGECTHSRARVRSQGYVFVNCLPHLKKAKEGKRNGCSNLSGRLNSEAAGRPKGPRSNSRRKASQSPPGFSFESTGFKVRGPGLPRHWTKLQIVSAMREWPRGTLAQGRQGSWAHRVDNDDLRKA